MTATQYFFVLGRSDSPEPLTCTRRGGENSGNIFVLYEIRSRREGGGGEDVIRGLEETKESLNERKLQKETIDAITESMRRKLLERMLESMREIAEWAGRGGRRRKGKITNWTE